MSDVVIRHLVEEDLREADRIIRLAFGTFMGHDNPEDYRSDARYANPRYNAYQSMLSQNFSIDFLGVSLHLPNNDAYNIVDRYVIDDWR